MKIATAVLIFAISFASGSFKKNNITTNICLSGSQDSLPALHTISDKDISSVTSSFGLVSKCFHPSHKSYVCDIAEVYMLKKNVQLCLRKFMAKKPSYIYELCANFLES